MRDYGDETKLTPIEADLLRLNCLDSLAADLVAAEGEDEARCNEYLSLSRHDQLYVDGMMRALPVLRSQGVVF